MLVLLFALGALASKETDAAPPAESGDPERSIPVHPKTFFDDCPPDQLGFAIGSIGSAIEIGAPRYNQGDHVGCYRMYLGTATDLVTMLPACTGVRAALLEGVVRASVLQTYTERAWAMRDAFDGVLNAYATKKQETPTKAP